MKKLLFVSLILLIVNVAFTQVYTFTGNGNWTNPANWSNGIMPPSLLPSGSSIIIDPAGNGECILNTAQTISSGATLTVQPGKKFIILGSLVIPAVLITTITTIGETTATVAGNITKDGGTPVIERGICYSLGSDPTVDSMKVVSGSGTGIFTANLTGLLADTLYHVRAYATSIAGTDYGNQVIFTPTTPPLYKLYGLGFSPYYDDQSPDALTQISEEQIADLLQKIAPFTHWVRSYGSMDGLQKVGINAHRLGLQVAGGAWLSRDTVTNQIQIANLIAQGLAGEIDVAVVGSEVLLRNDLTKTRLIAYINQVKAALPGIPVTTADVYQNFLSNPDLVSSVDVIYAHIYPFWEGKSIDCATNFIDNVYSQLQAVSQGKEIVVAETGWPSAGDPVGKAVPSPVNASTFFLHFISWAKIKQVNYFYFETIDESWKTLHESSRGAHWGIWEKNGGPLKPGMANVFNDVTIPDNWAVDTVAINAVSPSISLTVVPPICSLDNVEGVARGVYPSEYGVIVYIYVNGWYPKPTYAHPISAVECDGSFVCNYTTAPWSDKYATKIRAYLVHADFILPPPVGGPPVIPPEVEQNAIAWTEESRSPVLPIIITSTADTIALTTAVSGGTVDCYGGDLITAKGVCWSTGSNPTIAGPKTSDGGGNDNFSSHITGLSPNTTYYLRAYATNSAGTAYGNEISFTTAYGLPILTTVSVNNFPGTSASSGGNISDDGGTLVWARGVCWATTTAPTINNFKTLDGIGPGNFTSTAIGLMANTTYYLRAYATTAAGTAYGNEISFTSTQNTTFSIGQNYGGGIIFHIDGSGQHGLIAASDDELSSMPWSNGSFVATGATSATNGSANTTQIINAQGNTGSYAAKACRDYTGGGFTDWFLPAKDQLHILYGQRNVVGGFNNSAFYWSSTEIADILSAFEYFANGGQYLDYKSNSNHVRAIRAF
jgi:exo-beta-1,3-glucanase (GH17 family)